MADVCGIAGIVSNDPLMRETVILREMLGRLEHRGPDDEGMGGLGRGLIGARRLAVIDLERGGQPMTNEDGTVFAVQNGEIYNFEELRGMLASLGHRFRTRNDTEILPHAYEEWGVSLVSRLRGMFALAIWDGRAGRLMLARDRFGKKPLVYAQAGDTIVFSSEIQGLLVHPAVRRDVDPIAIDEYLTFGYIPPPRSAFMQIKKLEPAHVLVIGEACAGQPTRYWRPSFEPKLTITQHEAEEELRRRIDDAVRVRLISDVPLGAFLSGGLDSSTVVAYMAKNSAHPVKTFSVGFADQSHDESAFARIVARTFGTDHQEIIVDASDAGDLSMLVRHLGEPFADSSIVPTYQIARLTRQSVTVALTGDGGDELFAGYDRYKAAALADLTVERLPESIRRMVTRAAGWLPGHSWLPRPLLRGRRFLAAVGLEPEARFLRWTGYFTGDLHRAISGEVLRGSRAPSIDLLRLASELSGAKEPAERYMASDILMNLPGDLLVKMDIATMAASLEARSPLLDHELAEFVGRLPVSFKVSPRTSKRLLRRAMRGILPDAILRRGKMGFMAPVGAWLRGPLRPMMEDVVLGSEADRGYVDLSVARLLFKEHLERRADRTPLLWSLLMLELWFREVAAPRSLDRSPDVAHIA